jgi:KaiC/GvpD/RAD55 family RecA-like ATPase
VSELEVEYLPTGSPTLNGLLAMDARHTEGGILIKREDREINPIVLIEGEAGTGKTILALQMASAMATATKPAAKPDAAQSPGWKYQVLFYSLEQSIDSLKSAAVNFGFGEPGSKTICWDFGADDEDPPGHPPPGRITGCHLSPLPIGEREPSNAFEERFAQLQHMLKRIQSDSAANGCGRAVLFIDSLNALTTSALGRHEIHRLFRLFQSNNVPAIITAEYYEGADSVKNATMEAARFLSDVSIGLRRDRSQGYLQLYLEISKSRLGRQVFGRHLYKIRTREFKQQSGMDTPTGIVVYQSIHSVLSRAREDSNGNQGQAGQRAASPTAAHTVPSPIEGASTTAVKEPVAQNQAGSAGPPELRYRICWDDTRTLDIPLIIGAKYVEPGACFAIVGPPGTHKLALAMNLAAGWLEVGGEPRFRKLLVVEFGGTGSIKFKGVAWFQQRFDERWSELEPTREQEGVPRTIVKKGVKWWHTPYTLNGKPGGSAGAGEAPAPEADVLTFQLGELTPEECFHAIDECIHRDGTNEPKYSAVLLSNTAEMCTGFPALRGDPVFLPSLIDLFQMRGLVSVCIGVEGGGGVSQSLDFSLQAKADYRISLNHSPDMQHFMRHFGEPEAPTEQQVSLVIDNVIGKDYKRTPRWVSVDYTGTRKILHCEEAPHARGARRLMVAGY